MLLGVEWSAATDLVLEINLSSLSDDVEAMLYTAVQSMRSAVGYASVLAIISICIRQYMTPDELCCRLAVFLSHSATPISNSLIAFPCHASTLRIHSTNTFSLPINSECAGHNTMYIYIYYRTRDIGDNFDRPFIVNNSGSHTPMLYLSIQLWYSRFVAPLPRLGLSRISYSFGTRLHRFKCCSEYII